MCVYKYLWVFTTSLKMLVTFRSWTAYFWEKWGHVIGFWMCKFSWNRRGKWSPSPEHSSPNLFARHGHDKAGCNHLQVWKLSLLSDSRVVVLLFCSAKNYRGRAGRSWFSWSCHVSGVILFFGASKLPKASLCSKVDHMGYMGGQGPAAEVAYA